MSAPTGGTVTLSIGRHAIDLPYDATGAQFNDAVAELWRRVDAEQNVERPTEMSELARLEAEQRMLAAKAELAAAEQAYREIVPCPHSSITVHFAGHIEEWRCNTCDTKVEDPRGCQHRHIDNTTGRCSACGEEMLRQRPHPQYVKSVPNAAACTNPDCGGADDPNCTNPDGLYVPDTSRERLVLIQTDYTYMCSRCGKGTEFTSEGVVWKCGDDHRGDSVPGCKENA